MTESADASPAPEPAQEPAQESAPAGSQSAEGSEPWYQKHLWQMVPLQDAFWLAVPGAVIWFLFRYTSVSIPLLIGFALAYTIQPTLTFAEKRWQVNRDVLVGGILAAIVLIACGLTALLIPFLVDELLTLVEKTPTYVERADSWVQERGDSRLVRLLPQLEDLVTGQADKAASMAMQGLDNAARVLVGALGTTGFALTIVTTVPIWFLFFAWHYQPMLSAGRDLLPDRYQGPVLASLSKMDRIVGGFIRGRLIVMIAMMVMFCIGFWLTGVPYWLLIGCVTGLLSFIPYAAVLGYAAAIMAAWLNGAVGAESSPGFVDIVVWPTVAFSVVQLVEGWLLTPWIQSQSMNLSATAILVVLLVGGAVGGLVGLLLAIPIAGCSRILITDFISPGLKAWSEKT